MSELIDANKIKQHVLENWEMERNAGTDHAGIRAEVWSELNNALQTDIFDHTPPVHPDIKPGDRVNVVKSVQWDFLQDVRVNSIVDNHFGRFANLEYEGKEYTIKIERLEVITDDQPTKEA
jgi:hypothetical protein